jgi:hypothetical protein
MTPLQFVKVFTVSSSQFCAQQGGRGSEWTSSSTSCSTLSVRCSPIAKCGGITVRFLTAPQRCIFKIAPALWSPLHNLASAQVLYSVRMSVCLTGLTILHAATNLSIALFAVYAQSCAFLHQQCATLELQKGCAGKAENVQATKHIIEMLRLAKAFDATRLCTIGGKQPSTEADLHPDGSSQGEHDEHDGLVEAPARVLVYCKEKRTVQCSMQRPAEHYVACNCETAQQHKICHHQVAYLLQCSLDAAAAERLIHKMLGLRFGLLGGCTESDITVLWTSLSTQLPARATTTHAQASTNCGATAAAAPAEPQDGAVACENAAGPSSSKAAVAPAALGKVARQNWQDRCLQVLHSIFQDMDHAPSQVQRDLAAEVDSCFAAAKRASSGASHRTGCYAGAEFQKTESVSFKRKRGPLEKAKQRNVKSRTSQSSKKQPMQAATSSSCAPVPDSVEAQANFAHSSQCSGPDTQHQVSKAWEQRRGARQAAQHVQICLDHERSIHGEAQAGQQAKRRTTSKAPGRREQAPVSPQEPAVDLLGALKSNP